MFRRILGLVMMLVVLAACQPQATAIPLPTSTPLAVFEYQLPTPLPEDKVATAAAATAAAGGQGAVTLDLEAVARGANSWERLECGSCHGAQGEGGAGSVGDKTAPPLTDLGMSQSEFLDWMRTGGTMGNAHLFSADRLSDGGSRDLYQFMLSLGGGAE